MLVLRTMRRPLPYRRGDRQHALPAAMRRVSKAAAALAVLAAGLSGCTVAGHAATAGTVNVVIGYQSKTIDTVTAGTLLRSLGYFTQQLTALSRQTGRHYSVSWQDYSTGAPITAQMLAGKIDIGSMGDYPLLINGSRSQAGGERTVMLSVTGYN